MKARAALLIALLILMAPLPARAGFPGANGRIAFVSDRDGNQDIYTMNPDGSGQVNLTKNPGNDFDPAWSPDGTKIAFTSNRDSGWEIYVMNADGSGVIRLTNNPALDWTPSWSADGTKLIFTSYRAGGGELFVMNADGSAQVNLTKTSGYDFEPDWSPDGSKLTWRSSTGAGDVFVANSDGTGKVNLTNDPLVYEREPSWSPDGNRIAYASVEGSDFDIRLMNPDGTGRVTITTSSGNDYDPDWGAASGPPPSTFTLSVTKSGEGTVSSSPLGIKCGRDCSESYAAGAVVVLTAKEARGYTFAGWSGACIGTGSCTVTMTASKTATAIFMSG